VRDPDFGRYTLPGYDEATLRITPGYYVESGGLEETIPVTFDADGVFYGEYVVPESAPLGDLQFFLEGLDWQGYRKVTIAEYRAPEFLINMTPEKEEALRGETVDIVLDAQFFFGGPVSDVPVTWTIYEQAYYPDIPGPWYSFGDSGGFYYEARGPYYFGGGGPLGNYVSSGEGRTDGSGQVVITLPANLLQDVDDGSRKVLVEAFVSDLAEFPVSSRASVIFHGAETYVGIRPAEYSVPAGQEAVVELVTVDWDGEPAANQAVDVTFYRRDWEADRDNQWGSYYTLWTPVDTELASERVTTDARGQATASFTPEEGGSYLAVATVVDGGGRSLTSTTGLYALDPNYSGWRSAPREYSMELIPDQPSYRVGDTARILVQSPFAEPVTAWLAVERGNLVTQQVVRVSSSDVLEIPITPDFAPNVYISIAAVKPVEPENEERPFADIRFGLAELTVDTEQLALTLAITPQETNYAPGETAVFDIQVTDHTGAPDPGGSLSGAGGSGCAHPERRQRPPHPRFLLLPQPIFSTTGSGMFVSGEGLAIEEPVEFFGGGGGGGDGESQSALGRVPGDEDDARRDFRDTAYWEAKIVTDANGQATVEVPLPDNTTTWRMHGKAVTTDSLVDQENADIISTLPLLVRPVTPRFFTVGDIVEIGAIVNNNTGQALDVTVSLTAEGFEESSLEEQTVTIPANGRSLVRWPVTVADVEFADLTFRAEGGDYTDVTKPTFGVGPDQLIPVYRYDAPDTVATSGILEEAGRRVEAALLPANIDTRRGSMDVQLSPSLAAALIDALEAQQLYYDSVCAGSVADRLLPNAATARAITELDLDQPELLSILDGAVVADVAALQSLQRSDGGWGWCSESDTHPWLTAYALFGLLKAEEAGYGVDDSVLSRASGYLQRQLRNADNLDDASAANRQAFFLYVLAENGVDVGEDADALFEAQRGLLDPYAKALLMLAYEANGVDSDHQATLLADLNESVILSATGAHWEDASRDYDNLSSDIRGTAMVIDALARAEPDAAFAPQAVNWLMVARRASHWPSSHETAWSILALTDWLAATQELEAGYDWQLSVNTVPEVDGSFSQANITESVWESIPVANLVADDVNFFDFERGSGNGRLYYNMVLRAFLPAEEVEPANRGFTVQRAYYDAACDPETETCLPINQIEPGSG
jgi:alpha-2-macroglobulin